MWQRGIISISLCLWMGIVSILLTVSCTSLLYHQHYIQRLITSTQTYAQVISGLRLIRKGYWDIPIQSTPLVPQRIDLEKAPYYTYQSIQIQALATPTTLYVYRHHPHTPYALKATYTRNGTGMVLSKITTYYGK